MSDQQPHESGSPRSRREIREDREREFGAKRERQSASQERALDETLRSVRAGSAAAAARRGEDPAAGQREEDPAVGQREEDPAVGQREEDPAVDPGAPRVPLPAIAPIQATVVFDQTVAFYRDDLTEDGWDHTGPQLAAPSAVTPFDQVMTGSDQALSGQEAEEESEYAMAEESDFLHDEDLEDDYYEGTRIDHDDDGTPLLISSSSHGRGYQTVSAVEGGATQAVLEKRRRRRRRRNLTLSVAFGLFAVLLVGFVVVLQSLFGGGGPEDFETQAGEVVDFTVEEGDGPALVRNRLLEAGIIASEDAFDDALAELEDAPELQPGEFQLREQMPAEDALAVIFEQGEALHYISLQDNTRIDAALSSIAAQTGIPESDIRQAAEDPAAYGLPEEAETLEGYLAAGEYQPSLEATPEEILQTLVDTTFERLDELGITEEDEQWRTVIVASLLTAEGLPGDYEEIAGIIENRLAPNNSETDGLLQIDATVIYGLGTQSVHFTEEERADASNEYNTYQNPGLPPGPVAAPNMATLEAAANPDENDYFYWVTVDLETGDTEFASTYEEHLGYVEEFNAYCEDNPEICEGEPTQENAGP
ncbi:endolytic transglycosylase MltG [Nesterenkonia sp. E16_7]|uniref:endolytic transglycosylase MltG n=1 Tax=unclassified Nesterenkonia TaxID=2629769 RepID=UPI001A9236BA|nr:endolytic transglycosylase MltG [Nesterenkonia sp. E16_10]MBO0599669.1 endolytic transglycosylase MltG [Nesterenkonia sp. E16_7]